MGQQPDPLRTVAAELQEPEPQAADVTQLLHHAMHLERALEHARDIGIAMGIVMATKKVTRQGAFELLRTVSQKQNRRLFQVAAEVADLGELPQWECGRRPARRTTRDQHDDELVRGSSPACGLRGA